MNCYGLLQHAVVDMSSEKDVIKLGKESQMSKKQDPEVLQHPCLTIDGLAGMMVRQEGPVVDPSISASLAGCADADSAH